MNIQISETSEPHQAFSSTSPTSFIWREVKDMPDGRLPRHVQVIAALLSAWPQRAGISFNLKEGDDVLRDSPLIDYNSVRSSHEFETLVAKRIACRSDIGIYTMTREKGLDRLKDYLA